MTALKVYDAPNGIPLNPAFEVQVRSADEANIYNASWVSVPTYSVDAASINTLSNNFNKHPISVASFDTNASVTVRARYTLRVVQQAAIRPLSAGVKVSVEDGQFITFTLNRPRDLMLQVNDDKWQALHLLVNPLTSQRQRATLSMSGILDQASTTAQHTPTSRMATCTCPQARHSTSPAVPSSTHVSELWTPRMSPSAGMASSSSPRRALF